MSSMANIEERVISVDRTIDMRSRETSGALKAIEEQLGSLACQAEEASEAIGRLTRAVELIALGQLGAVVGIDRDEVAARMSVLGKEVLG